MDKIPPVYRSSFPFAPSGDSRDINENDKSSNVSSKEQLERRHDKVFGKVWIANKDLPKGSVLFSRQCLMVFPRLPTSLEKLQADISEEQEDKVNVCLGCCQMTKSLCPYCGWPLHNFECREWTDEQHLEECKIFRKHHIDFEDYRRSPHVYDLVAILRMCLLKNNKMTRTIWNSLLRLQNRFPPMDYKFQGLMKNFLLGHCKLRGITDKEINILIGTLHANRFSIQIIESYHISVYASFLLMKISEDFNVELFPMPHSCVPNTQMVFSKHIVLFIANKNIRKNEMLTMNYLNIPGAFLWLSRSDRRMFLKKRYYDKPCTCSMCKVNFSSKIQPPANNEDDFCFSRALRCPKCTNGIMILNGRQTRWKCKRKTCKALMQKKDGLEMEIKAEKLLFSSLISKLEMNDIIKKISICQTQLHPCHRILHRKYLEVLKNISDTLLYLMVGEDLSNLNINAETMTNIRDLCRYVFLVEFELSRQSNEPSFSLALSMVIGTYLELITAEEALQTNKSVGNLPDMITEMSHRMFMGLHCLWSKFLTKGVDNDFCLRLSNCCYRRLQSVKFKLKVKSKPPEGV